MVTLFTPESRARTAEQAGRLVATDDRVEGVVLVGSLAGTPDRWSDVDLEVVVADAVQPADVAVEWVDRIYETLPVVHHYAAAFGETLVRGFLLDDALELDLAFAPVAHFALWEPFRIMFDRAGRVRQIAANPHDWEPALPDWRGEAGLAWHDVLHACIAARRDRPWQALWYLERIRNRALALAQSRRGWYAEFFDYVDDLPTAELTPHTATLMASLERQSLLRAIKAATSLLLGELRRGEPNLSERLERPLFEMIDADSST